MKKCIIILLLFTLLFLLKKFYLKNQILVNSFDDYIRFQPPNDSKTENELPIGMEISETDINPDVLRYRADNEPVLYRYRPIVHNQP